MDKRSICTLIGHSGDETESGYHACGRCGEHEYWDSRHVQEDNDIYLIETDYHFNAVLFWPWWWVKEKLSITFPNKCADCGKRLGRHKDCLPF